MNAEANNTQVPFEFRGNAKEWFGIWIVNLLLSIVTLGIYSAWAKVRTQKYFYNNTYVMGRNFDYHATGKQILIGRIIVVGALIVYQVLLALSPAVGIFFFVLLLILLPALIVRSMQFNARVSSFSNVRFNFSGSIGQAFLIYLIYPILVLISLYTTAPILSRANARFSINNHSLGRAKFSFDTGLGGFYKAFGLAILWVVAATVLGAVLGGASLTSLSGALQSIDDNPLAAFGVIGLIYGFLFLALLPAVIIYRAMIRNEVYNATVLEGGHKLYSDVQPLPLLWIAVSNMIVVLCTLFLMLPWAQVRMARYLADHTKAIPAGSLDDFLDDNLPAGSAIGDAYTDIEAIDVGLPI